MFCARSSRMKLSIASLRRCAFAAVALSFAVDRAEAGAMLLAPDVIGFFDASTYSPEMINPTLVAQLFSAALPEMNGFAGRKIFGTATLEPGLNAPYLLGTAS